VAIDRVPVEIFKNKYTVVALGVNCDFDGVCVNCDEFAPILELVRVPHD
jgi:hypothetical protein